MLPFRTIFASLSESGLDNFSIELTSLPRLVAESVFNFISRYSLNTHEVLLVTNAITTTCKELAEIFTAYQIEGVLSNLNRKLAVKDLHKLGRANFVHRTIYMNKTTVDWPKRYTDEQIKIICRFLPITESALKASAKARLHALRVGGEVQQEALQAVSSPVPANLEEIPDDKAEAIMEEFLDTSAVSEPSSVVSKPSTAEGPTELNQNKPINQDEGETLSTQLKEITKPARDNESVDSNRKEQAAGVISETSKDQGQGSLTVAANDREPIDQGKGVGSTLSNSGESMNEDVVVVAKAESPLQALIPVPISESLFKDRMKLFEEVDGDSDSEDDFLPMIETFKQLVTEVQTKAKGKAKSQPPSVPKLIEAKAVAI